jgi:serine phosphatase RsbU (regulator of sigma subunit)
VVCYTDGLTELEDDLGEQYGLDRLNEFLFMNADCEVNETIEKLKLEMDNFRGTVDFNDDVSILLNRFF